MRVKEIKVPLVPTQFITKCAGDETLQPLEILSSHLAALHEARVFRIFFHGHVYVLWSTYQTPSCDGRSLMFSI